MLSYGSRLKLQNTLTVIIATAVLHNIAREMNEDEPPLDVDAEIIDHLILQGNISVVPQNVNNFNEGQNIRQEFVTYFERLG